VVADSHHLDEEQDSHPHISEKLDSDPRYSENVVPDPQESIADPQLSLWHCFCKNPHYGILLIRIPYVLACLCLEMAVSRILYTF
jgi:hypothetical protein